MPLPILVFAVVMLCWVTFGLVILLHKKPPSGPEQSRERASMGGLALQGLAYAIIWTVHRPFFTPLTESSKPAEIALAILAMALAIGSIWFVTKAVKALGKQWSIAARLVEGHQLVKEGPYRIVRNPIYTGMLGMLLATGLAISRGFAIVIAIVVFAIGTWIRVRSEEKLLRGAFGAEFEEYARRVPAVVPYLF